MKKLGVLIYILFALSLAVSALDDQGQPNDPNVNERANACYEDGSMAGKCDSQWAWDAGWYLIRFEYGMISREDFPAQYYLLLPSLPQEEAVEKPAYTYPTAGCIPYPTTLTYVNFNGGNYLPSPVTIYRDSACTILYAPYGIQIAYAPNGMSDAVDICAAHSFSNASLSGPDIYFCT